MESMPARGAKEDVCPLRRRAEADPEGAVAETAGKVLSAARADQIASGVARHLRASGVSSGDRVAFEVPAGPGWIPWLFGCFRAGGIVCPVNLRLPEPARVDLIKRVGARPRLNAFPQIDVCGGPGKVCGEDPATVVFTSGSTGTPRGIVHSLHQHLASAAAAVETGGMRAGERSLVCLALYHMGGLAVIFRAVLSGGTVVFPRPGESVAEVMARTPIDHVSLVPAQLRQIMTDGRATTALGGAKRILLGGAAAPEGVVRAALQNGLPVSMSYGMTETASQVAAVPPGWTGEEAWRTSGRVLPHANVVGDDDGDLWVRGNSVCMGEWRDGEVTTLTDPEGWLRTGDRARFEEGWLIVEGRRDRMFISGGENIQPEMIERALREVTGVEAVVVPVEDETYGQRPGVWIDAPVDGERVRAWNAGLRRRLPGFMIPVVYRQLEISDRLKPDLRELTRRIQRGE